MKFFKEISLDCALEKQENLVNHFVRINISQKNSLKNYLKLSKQNCTPILFYDESDLNIETFNENSLKTLIDLHLDFANKLKENGTKKIAIAADQDGYLQRLFSPRTNKTSIENRMRPMLDLYRAVSETFENLMFILTVEELAPAGIDATDGVLAARALEKLGLKEIIAASGSKDFMPLFKRRSPKKNGLSLESKIACEPGLAPAIWLIEHTKLATYSLCNIVKHQDACDLAKSIGLAGLIEKAPYLET